MTKANTKVYGIALLAVVAVIVLAGYIMGLQQKMVFGSTPSEASDYQATSTAENAVYGAFTTGRLIRKSSGSFGSVVITGANTGVLNFYNATTTDVNMRTGNKASSTILLASIPASAAADTYTFDVGYTDGLLLVLQGGTMPTSTITYR